jgi:hypothetical protein
VSQTAGGAQRAPDEDEEEEEDESGFGFFLYTMRRTPDSSRLAEYHSARARAKAESEARQQLFAEQLRRAHENDSDEDREGEKMFDMNFDSD